MKSVSQTPEYPQLPPVPIYPSLSLSGLLNQSCAEWEPVSSDKGSSSRAW